jgi:hypothetical protein
MTKLRLPESIEDAVFQAVALLGEDPVAHASDVSASLVRKWSDPDDKAHRIGLHQALAIDEALVKAGHSPVFGALFETLVPAEAAPVEPVEPVRIAMRITADASLLMTSVDAAMADKKLTPAEVVKLRAETGRLQKSIARLRRGLWMKR